jgi:hypothetical protein
MRDRILGVGLAMLAGLTGWGQMHKVAKPEQVVRAVGVYEWTGDIAKPKASRLVPVTLYINGQLEDAGVYVARPVPFALLSGNVYELQSAGVDKGLLNLEYARHMQATDAAGDSEYDDGWFGYGSFKAIAAPKKAVALRASKTIPVITSSGSDSGKPHFSTKDGSPTTSSAGGGKADDGSKAPAKTDSAPASTTASADPDRPTMKRRSDSSDSGTASGGSSSGSTSSGSTPTTSAGSAPADDPNRPVMKRRSDSTNGTTDSSASSTASTGDTPASDPDRPTMKRRSDNTNGTTDSSANDKASTGDAPANDPDRPTLKRRSPEEAKKAKNGANDTASVSSLGSLNEDPNRPMLHHGKPTGVMTGEDLPKLVGLPADLHQMVAVSDAANRDPHEFARPWDSETEHAAVLEKMQAMARAQLAAYAGSGAAPAEPVKTASKATSNATTAKKTAAARTAKKAAEPAPVALMDEELRGYTLSYGGAATYVYTAHTAGSGTALRYVTVVAQDNGLGDLRPAMRSATDAAHLDRTPRMRFVDVVDVEASNRASLLFELRGQSSRQFGLYRVIADRSDQIFLTGTTQ